MYSTEWLNISTNGTFMGYYSDDHIRVPRDVLRTAITTSATSVHLNITVHAASVGQLPPPTERAYFHFLHFASFEQQQRQFEIYSGKVKWKKQNNISVYELYSMQPSYSSSGLYMLSNVSLVATNDSVLPPLLNAIEIYYSIPHDDTITCPRRWYTCYYTLIFKIRNRANNFDFILKFLTVIRNLLLLTSISYM